MKRNIFYLCIVVFLLSALFPAAAFANEDDSYSLTDMETARVFLSPNFASDKTAFALQENISKNSFVTDLYVTKDGGSSWKKVDLGFGNKNTICSLAFLDNGTIIISGYYHNFSESFLASSENQGESFDLIQSNLTIPFEFYFKAYGNHLYGLFPSGSSSVLKYSQDGGSTWDSGDLGVDFLQDFNGLVILNDDAYLAITRSINKVKYFKGSGWRETTVPLYHSTVNGLTINQGITAIKDSGDSYTAAAFGPGGPGQFYISRDGGTSWNQVESYENWPSQGSSKVVGAALAPGGCIFAATDDRTVMVSEDYGASWQNVTDKFNICFFITPATWLKVPNTTIGNIHDIQCVKTDSSISVFAATSSGLFQMTYNPTLTPAPNPEPNPVPTPKPPKSSEEVKFILGQSSYSLNGEVISMDAAAFSESGRTFVPIRYLAQALGSSVDWNADTRKVTLTKGTTRVEIIADSNIMYANSQPRTMDVTPLNKDGRLYLPLRFAAEAFGYKANWDAASQSVIISR